MKNLNFTLFISFIFLQTSITLCRVVTSANNLGSFLSSLNNAPVADKVEVAKVKKPDDSKDKSRTIPANNIGSFLSGINSAPVVNNVVKPDNSNNQITLLLQEQPAKTVIPKVSNDTNQIALQSFLTAQSNPSYLKGMAILKDKQLIASYQKAISSISLFFINYSLNNLQTFHVKSAAPTSSITSFLSGIKNTSVAIKPVAHGEALASFLSGLSTRAKKPIAKKQPVFVLPPNL